MYAGFQSDSKPFTATATGASYYVDSIFQAGGNDIFNTYSDLIAILDNPASTDTDVTNAVAAALSSIDCGISTVNNTRSAVGTKLNELDALNESGESRKLQYA